MAAIFKRLQARYGHKWTSAIEGIEEQAVSEWSDGLSGLSGEQIKRGLASWQDDWPPSLAEFRAACDGGRLNGFGLDYVPLYYRAPPIPSAPLLADDAAKRKAFDAIAEMRRICAKTEEEGRDTG